MNFYDNLTVYQDQTAIITPAGDHISYAQLAKDSDNIASHLDRRALVICVCQNCYESVSGYLGFLRARCVPALIGDEYKEDMILSLIQRYCPAYIWAPSKYSKDYQGFEYIFGFGKYALYQNKNPMRYEINNSIALMLTTSGSTGSPKFVRQSYSNIDSNADAIAQYLLISDKDRPITTMPMHYTYGLSIINSHLLKGAAIILNDLSLIWEPFWTLLKREKATTFGGVPYTYEILRRLQFGQMDLPSIKVLTQAGGKLSEEHTLEFAQICEKKGIRFYVMYGQTEATARIAYMPSEYAVEKAGSIGISIPGGELSLLDENDEIIEQSGVVSEIQYKGPNVTLGYAQSFDDLSKGDENNGVLLTGDMASRDEEGFYKIVGRKKRMIKILGNRINLDELESILRTLGYDCACKGEDDHLKIYIANVSDSTAVRQAILKFTSLRNCFEVILVEFIHRNEAGKVLYSAL